MRGDKPTVVICGRPNVGKSTLFNRWVKKRKALVHRAPGMTRDRIAQDLGGYLLVDTGGIEFLSEDELSDNIRYQAKKAVEEAALILFIVDGASGLHPLDKDLSDHLHKLDLPVKLVVNKADVKQAEENYYEFSRLGWEDISLISSEHGIGTGTLRDEVEQQINAEGVSRPDPAIRIAIVGKPNVGKSSFINRLLDEPRLTVSTIPGTTRDSIDVEVVREEQRFLFIDTAGLRKRGQVREEHEKLSAIKSMQSIEDADICCLMVDINQPATHQDVSVASAIAKARKGVIFLANKSDLLSSERSRVEIRDALLEKISFFSYAPLLLISAKTGKNVHRFWDALESVNRAYHSRVPTGVLNRLFREFSMRHPSKRRRFFYITQTRTGPPLFILISNRGDKLGESYERFLQNRLRESVPFPGTPLHFKVQKRSRDK